MCGRLNVTDNPLEPPPFDFLSLFDQCFAKQLKIL